VERNGAVVVAGEGVSEKWLKRNINRFEARTDGANQRMMVEGSRLRIVGG
jgi:hypothetical protein